jgi:hypothetical protein
MTNPFEDFIGGVGAAVTKALNPNPTDAAVYAKDGHLYLKLIYADTSGTDLNIRLPEKDLKSIQQGILDHLLKE